MYWIVESLYYMSEANIVFYVNYIGIEKNKFDFDIYK